MHSKFQHFDVNNGLSQNSVWHILQDKSGYIWLVTSNGLNRFDGYGFTVYKNDPNDSNTLRSNHLYLVLPDDDGNLWIGNFGGIDRHIAATDKIERFYDIGYQEPCNYTPVYKQKDILWIWLDGKGVYAVNVKTKKIIDSIRQTTIVPDSTDACLKVVANDDQYLYFAFLKKGLVRYHKTTRKTDVICNLKHTGIQPPIFLSVNDSLLFFCTNHKSGALGVYHTRTNSLRHYNIGTEIATDACIVENEIIVALKGNKIWKIPENATGGAPNSIDLNGIFSTLLIDKTGVLWAGTDGMGFYKSIPNYRRLNTYVKPAASEKLVKSIFSQDSFIFSCGLNSYVDVFHKDGHYIKQLRGASKASFKSIVANTRENETSYWLMGENCFGVYDIYTERFTDYMPEIRALDTNLKTEMHNPAIYKHQNGDVFAGFGSTLIQLVKSSEGKYRPKVKIRYGGKRITSIGAQRNIVVVAIVDELHIYDLQTMQETDRVKLPTDLIKCMLFQDDSIIWAGTENGLYQYNLKNKQQKRFDEKNGLPNAFVYGLIRYKDHLWMSTNKGLSCYNIRNKTFRNYTVEDGLQSNEYNTGAYHAGTGDRMYFGGANGVNGFHDSDIADNPFVPQVQLTGIKLFEEPLKTDSAYWQLSSLSMPYYQNTLSFEFAAMEFSNPSFNQYAYMMEGIDKEWIYCGNKRFARYANLQPGNYRFLVKASNNNGVWQTNPKGIWVTIVPPFWKRSWFIVLCGVVAIGFIALIVFVLQRQQYRKKLRQIELQQKIQRERERISRDLHDNVGSQISYLVSNIDWITRHTTDEQEQQERLGSISTTAQNMMGNMRETIWALNKTAISLEELSDKLKAYTQHLLQYNQLTKFRSEEQLTGGCTLVPADALNIFRICQEAVSNAIKHAETALIVVSIQSSHPNSFLIQITDTGTGFDESEIENNGHYGLENMRHRAAESNVELTIQSVKGKGTTVTLRKV